MQKRLIVNADDFGYTAGVNRAIIECARIGIVRSTTLMANGAAFEDAVGLAQTADVAVGCHVVLVDGLALTGATHLASNGQLRYDSPLQLAAHARNRAMSREIEEETYAQIRRLQDAGVQVTHIDSHKHAHVFPAVLRAVLRGAKRAGVHRIRNPFEPGASMSLRQKLRADQRMRAVKVALVGSFRRAFLREVAREGFQTTQGSIGVIGTGTLDQALLVHMLDRLPPGTWELVCHPGYADDELRRLATRLSDSREIEREALASPAVRDALERNRVELADYRAL